MAKSPGRITGRSINWAIKHWYKLAIVACAVYATYSVHTLVLDFETVGQRFLDISTEIHNGMLRNQAAPLPLEPNTDG